MLDRCTIKAIIDSLPWPEGTKPILAFGAASKSMVERSFCVNLHEPLSRGWTDIARFDGPSPEGCLMRALENYIRVKGINNRPEFFDAIRRLMN